MKITEDLVSLNVNKTSHLTTKNPQPPQWAFFPQKKAIVFIVVKPTKKKIEKNQIRKENEWR